MRMRMREMTMYRGGRGDLFESDDSECSEAERSDSG